MANNNTEKKYYHVSYHITYLDFESRYSEFVHVAIDRHPYIWEWEFEYKAKNYHYKKPEIAIIWFSEITKEIFDLYHEVNEMRK